MALDLSNSESKIARANEHLEALKCEVEAINRERKPYAVRLQPNGEGTSYSLILRASEFREPRLGVILGDAVNNLRSALDYVIVSLVAKSGAELTTNHEFPIFAEEGDYITKAPRKLAGIIFGCDTIAHFQPFNQKTPRYDPLFVIQYFSNADKHRIISDYVPVIARLDDAMISPVPASVEQFQPPNYLRPNQEFEISRVAFAQQPREITFECKVTVSINFGTPAFGRLSKGLGASPSFFQHASDHVAMIVDTFKVL